jgi:hypothetical protein
MLLTNALAPLTARIGFVNLDISKCLDFFVQWNEKKGKKIEVIKYNDKLEYTLQNLVPIRTTKSDRHLLIPIKSDWTAYFDNGIYSSNHIYGTNIDLFVSEICKEFNCIGLSTVCLKRKFPEIHFDKSYLQFVVYKGENLNCEDEYSSRIRGITLDNYDGLWKFLSDGEPLIFEDIEKYKNERKEERLTLDMIESYFQYWGIDVFNENIYDTTDKSNTAYLLKEIGWKTIFNRSEKYSLGEIRGKMGYI